MGERKRRSSITIPTINDNTNTYMFILDEVVCEIQNCPIPKPSLNLKNREKGETGLSTRGIDGVVIACVILFGAAVASALAISKRRKPDQYISQERTAQMAKY